MIIIVCWKAFYELQTVFPTTTSSSKYYKYFQSNIGSFDKFL